MHKSLLKYLVCPFNKSELQLIEIDSIDEGNIVSGILSSKGVTNYCYPIINGIPRIYLNSIAHYTGGILREAKSKAPEKYNEVKNIIGNSYRKEMSQNIVSIQDSFSSEWDNIEDTDFAWGRDIEERRELFLSNMRLSFDDLEGKKVLDCGCGHGEVELALADSGAEIVAIDFSSSVDSLKKRLGGSNIQNVHLIQGNLNDLPLREKAFDILHSDGVLHHNPDTKAAFINIARALKPTQSRCYIMVYSNDHASRFEIIFTYYLIRMLKIVTTRMPYRLLHTFCRVMAPLAWIYFEIINLILRKEYYRRRSLNEIHLSLFDGFSPKYAHHHSFDST